MIVRRSTYRRLEELENALHPDPKHVPPLDLRGQKEDPNRRYHVTAEDLAAHASEAQAAEVGISGSDFGAHAVRANEQPPAQTTPMKKGSPPDAGPLALESARSELVIAEQAWRSDRLATLLGSPPPKLQSWLPSAIGPLPCKPVASHSLSCTSATLGAGLGA